MSTISFEYDPWRGGLCLQFGTLPRDRQVDALGGLLSVYRDEYGRATAIESFWDHGGLPLRGINRAESFPW